MDNAYLDLDSSEEAPINGLLGHSFMERLVGEITVTLYPRKRELNWNLGWEQRPCLAQLRPAGPMHISW
jgi:hypothetical protein